MHPVPTALNTVRLMHWCSIVAELFDFARWKNLRGSLFSFKQNSRYGDASIFSYKMTPIPFQKYLKIYRKLLWLQRLVNYLKSYSWYGARPREFGPATHHAISRVLLFLLHSFLFPSFRNIKRQWCWCTFIPIFDCWLNGYIRHAKFVFSVLCAATAQFY